ncbi:pentatricopeptide repeat-containing protein [Carex littledalei]|uniref:Pentatricopeptide repeat-containing protein n=1 Tax=Carex littledalei TaxID=544730 RepID=A0A833QK78_9POAL|nr:pentatricopeptide repeat-containing protein [Carex littledalei]
MAAASQFFPLSSSLQWKNKAATTASAAISSSVNPQFKHKRPSLCPLQVSLSEPQTAASSDQQHTQNYVASPRSQPTSSVWINPNSKRSKETILTMAHQPDARLVRLTGLASSLDNAERSEQAVSTILSSQTFPISEADAVLVINNMSCAENAVFALRWFLDSIQFSKKVVLYNVTLKVLRKAKNWALIESLWELMLASGTKPDHITFTTIISCARQLNLPAKAIEWFEKMPAFQCKPSKFTTSAMIMAYWRADQSDKALELFNQARTKKGQLFEGAFGSMITIYAGTGNFDGALNLFEEMKTRGIHPNLATYNVLLNAMLKAGRPWQVKTIFTEMCNNGVAPDNYTYNVLLRTYSKARYSKDALIVYQKMKEEGRELNVVLYNMLLSMCADMGLITEAEEIFDEMKKLPEGCRPDSWSYSSMITAYSCSGQVSEAEQMFSEMLDMGHKPTIFVFTSLIQCYGRAKQTDDVVRVVGMLPEFQVKPDDRFCGCLLNVATKTPSEELGKIINCIDSVDPNVGSFVKLLLDKNSSIQIIRERASELLDSLNEGVRKPYCNCLIDICINFGQKDQAHELFDLAVQSKIYYDLQERQENQWILKTKGLSYGAALTAMHVWIDDVSEVLEKGEALPPILGVQCGHGKHFYEGKTNISVLKERLVEMKAPFHEVPDKVGWLLTTDVAAKSWIEGAKKDKLVFAV